MMYFPRSLIAACAFFLAISTSSMVVQAQSNERGGPCEGASAPSQKVQVHVVGKQARQSIKVIGDFESGSQGAVTGELIVGQGKNQLVVTNWCRVWTSKETSSGHSSVTHLLGISTSVDGREMYAQVDLRSEEGGKVRVRTREIKSHDSHEVEALAEDQHEGWKSITGEGWLAVTKLRIATLGAVLP